MPISDKWTYGIEHEFADWPLTRKLTKGMTRNRKDYTIVNSDGIANDPKGIVHAYGGELNTDPTDSVDGQCQILVDFLDKFSEATVNYRSNLHVHIRVPGLCDDLPALKRIQQYTKRYLEAAFQYIDRVPSPNLRLTGERKDFELSRYRRRKISHHYMVSDAIFARQQSANSVDEFLQAEVPMKKGKPLWHLGTRACVNLRQLLETDTIEFRHFGGTINSEELHSALIWCRTYLEWALQPQDPVVTPVHMYNNYFAGSPFPKTALMDYRLEKGYQMTKCDGSIPRSQIEANIRKINGGYLEQFR